MTATWSGSAWSCAVRLVVEDGQVMSRASSDLVGLLERVDLAASRFRSDSALTALNDNSGRPRAVPKLLAELVGAALDAAARTGGAVDPTMGVAMRRIGYDRDITEVGDDAAPSVTTPPTPGRWRALRLHRAAGLITIPNGVDLDLGATAKSWTADRAAAVLSARYGTGVLVEIGGDVAVAGRRDGGWVIRVAEQAGGPGELVRIHRGGIATSTTTVRTWRRAGRTVHHIIDPATGEPTDGPWRTVTVAAASALEANTASTAAIVKGPAALDWLVGQHFAARLVDQDGLVHTTPGWPLRNTEADDLLLTGGRTC
ncbi:MAG: FAD:protein FMN transferase [Jatrophihabitans sp.]